MAKKKRNRDIGTFIDLWMSGEFKEKVYSLRVGVYERERER